MGKPRCAAEPVSQSARGSFQRGLAAGRAASRPHPRSTSHFADSSTCDRSLYRDGRWRAVAGRRAMGRGACGPAPRQARALHLEPGGTNPTPLRGCLPERQTPPCVPLSSRNQSGETAKDAKKRENHESDMILGDALPYVFFRDPGQNQNFPGSPSRTFAPFAVQFLSSGLSGDFGVAPAEIPSRGVARSAGVCAAPDQGWYENTKPCWVVTSIFLPCTKRSPRYSSPSAGLMSFTYLVGPTNSSYVALSTPFSK